MSVGPEEHYIAPAYPWFSQEIGLYVIDLLWVASVMTGRVWDDLPRIWVLFERTDDDAGNPLLILI
jgi:hypothetical protein